MSRCFGQSRQAKQWSSDGRFRSDSPWPTVSTSLPLIATPDPALIERLPPNLPREAVCGLYVHVPFCAHKCHYCDFYSITRQSDDRMAAFVDRVLTEAARWPDAATLRLGTVFIGGGTPSLLPRVEMARLLTGLAEVLGLKAVREFTVEVNPATADLDDLQSMRDHGVNRVSFGAQSFDPRALRVLERDHDPADVPKAVELARRAGIERQSLDLIYAIPGQTIETWEASLAAALATEVEHLSCYGLTYEPNTPLAVRRRLGRVDAASDDHEVRLFRHVRERLPAAGLRAYEISNYARPGFESEHNLGYWRGHGYIGLGPSAASHVGGVRWRNAPHLGQWERAIDADAGAAIEVERLDPAARLRERLWLGLRMTEGVNLAVAADALGVEPAIALAQEVRELVAAGWLAEGAGRLTLTDRALPVADAVASRLLTADNVD